MQDGALARHPEVLPSNADPINDVLREFYSKPGMLVKSPP